MLEMSSEVDKIFSALSKAQGKVEGAKKEVANTFFKSRYADLSSVWEACRAALTENELAVVQTPSCTLDEAGGIAVHVTTMLTHASGQWIRDTVTMRPKENSPQGVGSTITYARRYALAAIAGVAPEDDDGNAASGRGGATVEDVRAKFQKPVTPIVRSAPGNIVTPATAQSNS